MNRKIPFHELASLLAGNCNITPAEAEDFIRNFFDLITQQLIDGETVKIKGIGIFAPTGDASDPVSFTPAPEIADTINAPFAMFEPEEVSDTLSNEAFEEFDRPQEQPEEEIAPATEEVTEVPAEEPVAIDPEPESEPAPVEADITETVTEDITQPITEEATETIPEPVVESIHSGVAETATETAAEVKPEPTEVKQVEPEETAPVAPIAAPTPSPVPVAKPAPVTQPKPVAPVAPVFQKATPAPADIEEEPEEYYQEPQQKSGAGFGWGFVIGMLVGLALGACGVYFAIDYIFPTMPATYSKVAEEEEEVVAMLDSVAAPLAEVADTVAAPAASAAAPEPEATPAKTAEEAKPAAAAEVVKDTVRPGYLLNDMAKKHYGNKCFWVYIYEENKAKIANPNRVGPGLELVIPPAEKYGINASNQASIKAANEKAGKILTKYPK